MPCLKNNNKLLSGCVILGKGVSKRRFRVSGDLYHKRHLRKMVLQNNESVLDTNLLQVLFRSIKIRIRGSRWSLACQRGGISAHREWQSGRCLGVVPPPQRPAGPWGFLRKPSRLSLLSKMPEAGGSPWCCVGALWYAGACDLTLGTAGVVMVIAEAEESHTCFKWF